MDSRKGYPSQGRGLTRLRIMKVFTRYPEIYRKYKMHKQTSTRLVPKLIRLRLIARNAITVPFVILPIQVFVLAVYQGLSFIYFCSRLTCNFQPLAYGNLDVQSCPVLFLATGHHHNSFINHSFASVDTRSGFHPSLAMLFLATSQSKLMSSTNASKLL